ncbi:UNVERIFIED_CONTAM: hypothetical protein Sindi_0386400 [Sesamum indicum]
MYAITHKLKALKPVFRHMRRNKGDLTINVQLTKDSLRQPNNWILQINDEHGTTYTELEAVIHEFVSFYQALLGGGRRMQVIDIKYLRPWARHVLNEKETLIFLQPVTTAEVKQAVFDIAEEKAPGPNGFFSGFYKAAWPIVDPQVTEAILDFFATRKMLKQINTTLLALIPNVHSPKLVTDFRPISCCNVLYKVTAKIIVQKLSRMLDKLISPCQATFVLGRSIGDNVMLAQELFTGYSQVRLPPRCALNVDIQKA